MDEGGRFMDFDGNTFFFRGHGDSLTERFATRLNGYTLILFSHIMIAFLLNNV
jgi:hypothetical protein